MGLKYLRVRGLLGRGLSGWKAHLTGRDFLKNSP